MASTLQLVVYGVAALEAVFLAVRGVRRMIQPPASLDDPGSSATQQLEIARAKHVVLRAIRTARWPTFGIVVVATFISDHISPDWLSYLVLGMGFLAGLLWHSVATRRWWRWALRQDADLALVEELAEDAVLIHPRDSWFGRRQRRTWMRLPAGSTEP